MSHTAVKVNIRQAGNDVKILSVKNFIVILNFRRYDSVFEEEAAFSEAPGFSEDADFNEDIDLNEEAEDYSVFDYHLLASISIFIAS